MRAKIRLNNKAEMLHEALGLKSENIVKVIEKLKNLVNKSSTISEVIEQIWNDNELSNEEVVLALIYLSHIVIDSDEENKDNSVKLVFI